MTIAHPYILRMSPYALADLSVPAGKVAVPLSQNESFRAPSPRALQAAADCLVRAHLYPDPNWTALRAVLARQHAVEPESILCGNGSLDLIGCIARVFAGPRRAVLAPEHSYPFFRTASEMAGARFDTAPEKNMTVDVEALVRAQQPDTGLVFVANPGNPTGTRISKAELLRLREGLRPDVLLVVDEAYGEFADALSERCFDMVSNGNTVVLRTFSKAYAMAGFRVGWGVFPTDIGAEVRKILNPNNVSLASQAAAEAAVVHQDYMLETCVLTTSSRNSVTAELTQIGFQVIPSHTNFVLMDMKTEKAAQQVEASLSSQGIFLRRQAGAGLPHALRMTIGDEAAMRAAVLALRNWKLESRV